MIIFCRRFFTVKSELYTELLYIFFKAHQLWKTSEKRVWELNCFIIFLFLSLCFISHDTFGTDNHCRKDWPWFLKSQKCDREWWWNYCVWTIMYWCQNVITLRLIIQWHIYVKTIWWYLLLYIYLPQIPLHKNKL